MMIGSNDVESDSTHRSRRDSEKASRPCLDGM